MRETGGKNERSSVLFLESAMTIVDLKFPVIGKKIPSDHGYLLYSAISNLLPEVHNLEDISIRGISGVPDRSRGLNLGPASALNIRIDHSHIPVFLKLAGKELKIGDDKVRLKIPITRLLKPRSVLYSRLVTIKGFLNPMDFLDAVRRQLKAMGIEKETLLFSTGSSVNPVRKTLRIHDKEIVGFPLVIPNLEPEESILIQTKGIGGRRKMGCGCFVGIQI